MIIENIDGGDVIWISLFLSGKFKYWFTLLDGQVETNS